MGSIIGRMQSFKDWFRDYADNFVIIGGTACSLIMSEEEVEFRPTKDVDVVLLVESLSPAFGKQFWDYVIEAGYVHRQKSTGKPEFYRFYAPKTAEYPEMIELFSRRIDGFVLSEDVHMTPIPIGEDISSLSAILLNDEYYHFLRDGIRKIDDLPILDELHLIPFKAKAWLELTEQRAKGGADANDIRKHKRDIYRLSDLITPGFKFTLPAAIDSDMRNFIFAVQKMLSNTPPKERRAERAKIEKLIQLFGLPSSLLG
ncbi:MAG: hypothetical protein LBC26_02445 [Oscillospiraceae bacterium]|nr:hypothetical protein [Oscillospiraceae bacterium]